MNRNVQSIDIRALCQPGTPIEESTLTDGIMHIALGSSEAWNLVRRILGNFEENGAWEMFEFDVLFRRYDDIDREAWERGETE